MRILLVSLLIFGCENGREWIPLLSSSKWYQDIPAKEKRLKGKIYDKGITRWIVKGDIRGEKGIVKDEELEYKKGEEYNRFLFEPGFTIYELYLGDFWVEEKLVEILNLKKEPLSSKKFEIIGKERVFEVMEGGRKIKRREFIPGMIREK